MKIHKTRLDAAQKAWLSATFDQNRARFGDLRMEATAEPVSTEQVPAEVEPAEAGPNGYPVNAKPADMTAEHQVAYYKHRARLNEDRAKENERRFKELEPAAAQVAALEEASRTEAERAALKARQDGEKAGREAADAEALNKFAPRLVGAEFRAQLAGRMTAEQTSTLVGGLHMPNFLTAEGDVDTEKVAAFVAAIPAATAPASTATPLTPSSLGAGRQTASPSASGRDLYAQMHPKRSGAATT